jgi:hypothetical protein
VDLKNYEGNTSRDKIANEIFTDAGIQHLLTKLEQK